MRIVGVIDIHEGRAVHARGGQRSAYAPIGVAACERIDGDPLALARVYVDMLGVRELYVADLDAIERGPAAMNAGVLRGIAASGVPVFIDAGVSSAAGARAVAAAGASVVVVGLETLRGLDALAAICDAVDGGRVAFSVDLRDGQPITMPNAELSPWMAEDIAAAAVRAGAGSVIVLDLARVGTSNGVDSELLARVRRVTAGAVLFAGGGVRDSSDLERLAEAGCDGALVATALLSGAIRVRG